MTIPKDNSQLENACKTLSVTFGDSSPRGRAKGEGGRCNCAACHNSIKKRSASALMRSVNCLTNAPLNRRAFVYLVHFGSGGRKCRFATDA